MQSFRIKAIILDESHTVLPKRRNAQPKRVHQFQTWLPGVGLNHNTLYIDKGIITIENKTFEFKNVMPFTFDSVKDIFSVDIFDRTPMRNIATVYLEGNINDFKKELQTELFLE